jgi:sugar-phosphatase
VLVDSAECVERTWRAWAARHGINPDRVMEVAHGRRTHETVPLLAPHLDVAEEVAALAAVESTTTEGVYEVPGARELLERLPLDMWAVVTSGVRSVATLRIRHTGLPMPGVLVCADEIDRGKPDPQGYLIAAERLGKTSADCVVIEDAPAGLEAARAAGMRSIGIVGTYPAEALGTADVVVARLDMLAIDVDHRLRTVSISTNNLEVS